MTQEIYLLSPREALAIGQASPGRGAALMQSMSTRLRRQRSSRGGSPNSDVETRPIAGSASKDGQQPPP